MILYAQTLASIPTEPDMEENVSIPNLEEAKEGTLSDHPPPTNQKEEDEIIPELLQIEQEGEKEEEQDGEACPDEKDKGYSVPVLDLPIPNQKDQYNETIYSTNNEL